MGDRGNVALYYGEQEFPIYLYTHWGGSDLREEVAEALNSPAARGRWNDPPYLARIIFSYMIRDDLGGAHGFGIAPYRPDQEHPDVVVSLEAQTVNGLGFQEFIDQQLVVPAPDPAP